MCVLRKWQGAAPETQMLSLPPFYPSPLSPPGPALKPITQEAPYRQTSSGWRERTGDVPGWGHLPPPGCGLPGLGRAFCGGMQSGQGERPTSSWRSRPCCGSLCIAGQLLWWD